jgi:TolB-like protein
MALLLAGCPFRKTPTLKDSGYTIAEGLIYNLKDELSYLYPVLVTTVADVDHLKESTTLGRVMSEMISSHLSQMGYKVIEIRMAENKLFFINSQGEFVLSRDVRDLARKYSAQAVVAGTHGAVDGKTYISARIIRCDDGQIISSYDYIMPKEEEDPIALKF